MADHSAMKLGKRPAQHDPRTLRLARYLPLDLPAPPDVVDFYSAAQRIGMMLNDQLGDCGPAMVGHQHQLWTASNGVEWVPADEDVVALYREAGDYVDGDPSTDNGVIMLRLMNSWRRVGIAGRKIDGYVALDLKDRELFKLAIHLFGSVSLGFDLPLSAQTQDGWFVAVGGTFGDPTPGSWGGHAVPGVGYDERGLWIVTWGELKFVTWDFVDACCDEAYAPLSDDWADFDGAPNGMDIETLRKDLQAVAA